MDRMASRLFLLAFAALLTLDGGAAARAASPTPTVPVPLQFFGMHTLSYSSGWPSDITIGALGKGTQTVWPYLERSPGVFYWNDLDQWVSWAESHKVDIFYTFGSVPAFYTSNTSTCVATHLQNVKRCSALPSDMTKVDNFVRELVTRYRGRIKYYELYNEPETPAGLSPADLVKWTNRVIPLIRSLDPTAKIISPSLSGRSEQTWYFKAYFEGGASRDFDIVSVHTYPSPSLDPTPESVDQNYTGLKPMFAMVPQYMSTYGLTGKPIWSTEGSWGLEGQGIVPTDEDTQAAYVARSLLLHWSNGIERYYWYAWPNNQYWGRLSGRKAAIAYAETQEWMLGAVMNGPCTSSSNVYTCKLTRNGQESLAVWTPGSPMSYNVGTQYIRYRTLDGTVVLSVSGRTVQISSKPILLEATVAPAVKGKGKAK